MIRIKHPSTFIRYTDDELTPEERMNHATYALLASENRPHILRAADPVWNEHVLPKETK